MLSKLENKQQFIHLTKYRLLFIAAFWLGVILIIFLSLLPGQQIPTVKISDKLQHFLAYFFLAAAGFSIYSYWRIILFLVSLGGILELLQSSIGTSRFAEWGDFLANSSGILLALVLFYLLDCFFYSKE